MKQFMWIFFIYLCTILNAFTKGDVLSDKVQQLTEWSLQNPVIRLNTERFNHYVKTTPKNYSIIVMLTALSPQRQCAICKSVHDEYEAVAQSYRYSNVFSNKLFFAMVDFDDGTDVFHYLKLNTAPVIIYFQPKVKYTKSDHMDINRGFTAEQIAKWVKDRAQVQIQIVRPQNYSVIILMAVLVIMIVGFLYMKRNSLRFLYNNILWGIFVILFILTCISGQVWNSIRDSPFVHRNPKTGAVGYFSGSSGYQFKAETYIVFLLYFGVSVGMILLNEVPKLKSKKGKRTGVVATIGLLMVMFLFSYILSIFRSKYQGYPYSFLFK